MDILNNREIAIALWILAASVYIFSSPKMVELKNATKDVLAALFVRKIMTIIFLMVAYMAIVIYWLSEWKLWNFDQIKNTLFWCVSVGFISLLNIEKIKKDHSFFRHSVLDNLKLLATLQFVVSVYTFSLWIEILLVPVLVLLGVMLSIAKTDRKYHQVQYLLEYCLALFGVILIIYTLYMLMTDFGEFGKEKTAYDFLTPPLLTLVYLPFIFFMLVYSTYERVFVMLRFSIKNRFHRCVAKFFALIFFNVRLSLLERWSFQVAKTDIKSYSDIIDTFKYIFKSKHSEKNQKEVPIEQGWSPYKAKEFLVNEGLSTGFYNRFIEDEWFASSPMKELNDGIIPDNIAYYVEGSEDTAKVLKLIVNVNDSSRTRDACEKLEVIAEILSISSLNLPLSQEIKSAILDCNPHSEKVGNKTITLTVQYWPNHNYNGLDIKFLISSI
ncbi:hypothetical protein A9B99_06740 [Mangrovibacter phragmitis]|uniref:Uncharacterized protein n=1 Tax=Mangrovibacter phragmitis TaxID=1691903 RepID=A0A1B7L3M1_9ENTR|nr:hypothetical protein [Mangrovibacter phragmitis]OAT77004.1 hypothetical protein A9B99_06740 [Mangrovibacter phragmitis]